MPPLKDHTTTAATIPESIDASKTVKLPRDDVHCKRADPFRNHCSDKRAPLLHSPIHDIDRSVRCSSSRGSSKVDGSWRALAVMVAKERSLRAFAT